MRAVIAVSRSDYFWTHREAVAREARRAGFEVHVVTNLVTPEDDFRRKGLAVHHLEFPRGTRRPVRQVRTVYRLQCLYRRLAPAVIHHVSLQSIIWGGLAAQAAGCKGVINAYTGLGSLLVPPQRTTTKQVLWQLLRRAHSRSAIGLFQNREDLADCVQRRVVRPGNAVVIAGSGVDVRRYTYEEPSTEPIVLLAGRLIWPKGVREFTEAAAILRRQFPELRCIVAGAPDEQNSRSCSSAWLAAQSEAGVIRWVGHQAAMDELLHRAAIVVLPTWYGEGIPKVLLEAAASGRPMVATDHRGCREVVIPSRTGLLVPPRDPRALAEAIVRLWINPALRAKMGRAARELAVHRFNDTRIARQTVALYRHQAQRLRRTKAHRVRRRRTPTQLAADAAPSPIAATPLEQWTS